MAFRVRLSKKTYDFLATLNEDERGEFIRCLDLIGADPHPDGEYKTTMPRPPVVYTVYYNGSFSIIYHLASSTEINVVGLPWPLPAPALGV